ncbi:TrlF family AAA-like ATPase [Caballeronia sp. LjRoot29]|uniref:TrlF family AAA-like ATPase n=1 Tax=Caballeronia sp. LjRoot29 TaxID=3342315 RepID=UPI003F4F814C
MRWVKCDLQMQTPADAANWRGGVMGSTVDEQVAAAEAYIRRCHEVGLEVIAITDHNYLSRGFIPLLQAAIEKLAVEFGYRLVLFPGFEFEADVGKGVHVLALFEPNANLDEIDHILTECGVGYPRAPGGILAKSTKRLPELLGCIQKLDEHGHQRGIVIMPHAMKDDGLFDNGKVADWLQQTEYLNLELFAVEVPKPVRELSPGWRRLFGAGSDCDPAWRRERPIACIMSSDNKALTPEENAENYIGMRHTWIKMSKPSIESLRQAFLDHGSRVRLQDVRPSDQENHPRIVSIAVQGAAFLEDQTVRFAPNLNCVVGGRGSGKSSLLEYLRFCLQPDYLNSVDRDLHEKLLAIHRTVEKGDAEIQVTYEISRGVEDTVLLKPGNAEHRLVGREVHDLQTVLKLLEIQFFSQGELSRLSKPGQKSQVLRLIDASSGTALVELTNQETGVRGELEQLFTATHQAEAVSADMQRLKQELEELGRQWQARNDIQADAATHQQAQGAKRFVENVVQHANTDALALQRALASFDSAAMTRPENASTWPHAEWFQHLEKEVSAARSVLIEEVKDAELKYVAAITALFSNDPAWPTIQGELDSAEAQFLAACAAKGVQPTDVSKLQEVDRLRTLKQDEANTKSRQLIELQQHAGGLTKKLADLHALWLQQYEIRKTACALIQGEGATALVTVGYMRDSRSFQTIWNRLAPRDSRTRLGKNWDDLGSSLFAEFAQSSAVASPWELLQQWLDLPATVPFDSPMAALIAEVTKHLQQADVRPIWEQVRMSRVDDLVDVELKRADGSSAGRMSGEGGKILSEGQRNTALLSLLLAQGKGPIVIDQPEDELDSNYIFSDLVPLLRAVKEKRQLILATHNANLPVNADAELIYAFDARDGRGAIRTQGGLDRADVTLAVLDIMEGSEKAFKQRSEKYHF